MLHKIAKKNLINENSFLFQINDEKFLFYYKNPNYNIIIHKVKDKLLNEKLNISNDNINLLNLKFEDYLCDTNINKQYYIYINDYLKLFVFQSYNQKQEFDKFIKKYNIESIMFINQ